MQKAKFDYSLKNIPVPSPKNTFNLSLPKQKAFSSEFDERCSLPIRKMTQSHALKLSALNPAKVPHKVDT